MIKKLPIVAVKFYLRCVPRRNTKLDRSDWRPTLQIERATVVTLAQMVNLTGNDVMVTTLCNNVNYRP